LLGLSDYGDLLQLLAGTAADGGAAPAPRPAGSDTSSLLLVGGQPAAPPADPAAAAAAAIAGTLLGSSCSSPLLLQQELHARRTSDPSSTGSLTTSFRGGGLMAPAAGLEAGPARRAGSLLGLDGPELLDELLSSFRGQEQQQLVALLQQIGAAPAEAQQGLPAAAGHHAAGGDFPLLAPLAADYSRAHAQLLGLGSRLGAAAPDDVQRAQGAAAAAGDDLAAYAGFLVSGAPLLPHSPAAAMAGFPPYGGPLSVPVYGLNGDWYLGPQQPPAAADADDLLPADADAGPASGGAAQHPSAGELLDGPSTGCIAPHAI
jgi:hypothetical protein